MRIDAHHHFWHYTPDEYGWIDDTMSAIRRDFLPADLAQEIASAGIDAVISVQARQTIAETEFLLAEAIANPWIAGVVGWLPLAGPDISSLLERFAPNPWLKGVRHVLQGAPDAFMENRDFNFGLSQLRAFHLTYDILIYHAQLPAAIRLVDRHPDQVFVLDHIAKPAIRSAEIQPWARNLAELARRPNVFCKLSGVVTEANYTAPTWDPTSDQTWDQIQPYMAAALEAFTPSRVMFGSDWPVCHVAVSYADWVSTVERFTAPLTATEREAIFHTTAARAYRIE